MPFIQQEIKNLSNKKTAVFLAAHSIKASLIDRSSKDKGFIKTNKQIIKYLKYLEKDLNKMISDFKN